MVKFRVEVIKKLYLNDTNLLFLSQLIEKKDNQKMIVFSANSGR